MSIATVIQATKMMASCLSLICVLGFINFLFAPDDTNLGCASIPMTVQMRQSRGDSRHPPGAAGADATTNRMIATRVQFCLTRLFLRHELLRRFPGPPFESAKKSARLIVAQY